MLSILKGDQMVVFLGSLNVTITSKIARWVTVMGQSSCVFIYLLICL